MITEIICLALAVLVAIIIYKALKTITPLIVNGIAALIVLWLLNFAGLNIVINIFSVLIVAIGGLAGLALVVLLHLMGIAF